MNQNERGTNNPSANDNGAKSSTLPTKDIPAGDQTGTRKQAGGIQPGQPEVARGGTDTSKTNEGGEAMKAPANEQRNGGSKR